MNSTLESTAPDTAPMGSPAQAHLKDYFRILLARRWVLASVVLLVAVSSLVWLLLQQPQYMSTATLLIDTNRSTLTGFQDVEQPVIGELSRRSYVDTMVQLLTARPLLERTFSFFNLGDRLEYKELKDPVGPFAKHFTVAAVRNSQLLKVSFSWSEPAKSRDILDYLVQEFITETRKRRLGVTLEGYQALQDKAEPLRQKVEGKAAELNNFMLSHNMVSFDRTADILVNHLKDLGTRLTQVQKDRISYEGTYQNTMQLLNVAEAQASGAAVLLPDGTVVTGGPAAGQPGDSLLDRVNIRDLPEVGENQVVRDLKRELLNLQQELENLNKAFGTKHPTVIATQARLTSTSQKLEEEVYSILIGIKVRFERLQREEQELTKQLREEEDRVIQFKVLEQDYNRIDAEYQTVKKTYDAIQKRLEEIEIVNAAGSRNDNIFVVEPPKVPVRPYKPQKARTLALALILGVLLGCGCCFFIDYLDTTIKGKDDIQNLLHLPVLGYVPAIGYREIARTAGEVNKSIPPELFSVHRPRSSLAESFRSIRTAITLSGRIENMRHLLVSSASSQEGKTMVSTNISLAMAQAGKKVLLVDADMRKPRVHKVFGLDNRSGLSQMLVGGEVPATLEGYTQYPDQPNLYVLPCGPIPPNPAELLGNGMITQLLAQWDKIFDMVVFDTPPIINVTDSAVLCQYLSGAILVFRSFATQRELAVVARNNLAQAQGRIFGVVLNNVDVPRGGYYSYDNYYYYSGYYYYYGDGEGGRKVRERRRRHRSRSQK